MMMLGDGAEVELKKKLGESSFISIYKKKKSPPNLVDLYYMFLFLFISLKPVCFLSFCLATVRWFPFFFSFHNDDLPGILFFSSSTPGSR